MFHVHLGWLTRFLSLQIRTLSKWDPWLSPAVFDSRRGTDSDKDFIFSCNLSWTLAPTIMSSSLPFQKQFKWKSAQNKWVQASSMIYGQQSWALVIMPKKIFGKWMCISTTRMNEVTKSCQIDVYVLLVSFLEVSPMLSLKSSVCLPCGWYLRFLRGIEPRYGSKHDVGKKKWATKRLQNGNCSCRVVLWVVTFGAPQTSTS